MKLFDNFLTKHRKDTVQEMTAFNMFSKNHTKSARFWILNLLNYWGKQQSLNNMALHKNKTFPSSKCCTGTYSVFTFSKGREMAIK